MSSRFVSSLKPSHRGLAALGSRARHYSTSKSEQSLHGSLKLVDPELARLISAERDLHQNSINLMAMETYPTKAVYQASNCYLPAFEGYPGKRYHPATTAVDSIERLCIDRTYQAFNLDREQWVVNVQAMTGSLANIYTYNAFLDPGQPLLRMELSHGGHISHGHRIQGRNISETAHRFNPIPYHVNLSTGLIDYNEIETLTREHRPKLIVVGGSSYCRHIDFSALRTIADQADALIHYDMSHVCGLVASGVFPTPFPFCDVVTTTPYKTLRGPQGALIISKKKTRKAVDDTVFPRFQCGTSYRNIAGMAAALRQCQTEEYKRQQQQFVESSNTLCRSLLEKGYRLLSGGTDTHMVLVDLRGQDVTGFEAESVLSLVNIIANRNAIPGDRGIEFSGVRLATPPMVIRGMGARDFVYVAELVHRGIDIARRIARKAKVDHLKKGDERQQSARQQFLNYLRDGGGFQELSELRRKVSDVVIKYPLPDYLSTGM